MGILVIKENEKNIVNTAFIDVVIVVNDGTFYYMKNNIAECIDEYPMSDIDKHTEAYYAYQKDKDKNKYMEAIFSNKDMLVYVMESTVERVKNSKGVSSFKLSESRDSGPFGFGFRNIKLEFTIND